MEWFLQDWPKLVSVLGAIGIIWKIFTPMIKAIAKIVTVVNEITKVVENHFRHEEATLDKIEQHMGKTNEALAILIDRVKR